MATTQPAPDTVSDEVPTAQDHSPSEPSGQPQPARQRRRITPKRAAFFALLVFAAVALVAGATQFSGQFSGQAKNSNDSFVYHTVRRGDLTIVITERGTLESRDNIEVKCEVDDVHGDGVAGTPILWIVENGTAVKKGDILVELDSAQHLERLDRQILNAERSLAKKTQANIQADSQPDRNKTREMKAELDVQLSRLALEQYEDESGGTFQIALQEIDLGIQQAEARRKIVDRNFEAVKKLNTLGYKSVGDLSQARLDAIKTKNIHKRQQSKRRELITYSYKKQRLKLEGAVESAKRSLIQKKRDSEARLKQSQVASDTADRAYDKEQERLADYREQLEKCKIYAPQDGMVAYAVSGNRWGQQTTVEEGAAMRDRQHILSLPDLTRMQVKTAVHESVVDQTKVGLPVSIRIDAFPGQSYTGSVTSVAVLPDPGGWLSTGAKVYTTVISIDGTVKKLKPGMTAVTEINVEVLHDVLSMPIQALVQRGNATWCYVAMGNSNEKRPVKLGKTNDKYVEILSGVELGDRVILNPDAVLDVDSQSSGELSPETSHDSDVTM